MTREIEILRGDLVEILVEAARDRVNYRFGTQIASLENRNDAVDVTFADGSSETFDIVIAADGMNSSTRKMIIGDGDHEAYLGCWSSYFTIPRVASDNDWWRWYTSQSGEVVFLRPDNEGTMRASVNFLSDDSNPDHMTLDDKKHLLVDRLTGAGWECDRIAGVLDDVDDIFLGPLHQIKARSWFRGRCVLVGDSAYCPTPYTGMGTTLAIIGSFILANEIAVHENPADAFAAYEHKFRGFVEKSQKLPPFVPDIAYAESRLKVGLINVGAAIAASTPVQALISLLSRPDGATENAFALPDYPDPT